MRPLIGITSYVEKARWGVWDTAVALVPYRYVSMVQAVGGRAVVVPPDATPDDPLLDRLDGLLLAGGADISPARYGAEPDPQTVGTREDRDNGELAVLGTALERPELPVLGVCRGMQLLVVATGGSLVQHLPDVVGHDGHRGGEGVYATHPVRLADGSLLADVLGPQTAVKSYHHQGVAALGPATRATGWAPDDTVEAVEVAGHRFAAGVLWHPEVAEDLRLFEAFVRAAAATAG